MRRGRDAIRVGHAWEARAARFLRSQGLELIVCGYRCRLGELDIVANDSGSLVIVEVRARRQRSHGTAADSVNSAKQQRIIRATRHFLMRNPHWSAQPIRFDVLAIDGIAGAEPQIAWIRNAFDAT